MNKLQVKGKQEFMGKEIPVVLGGFGPDKKCICDKTIAELHEQPTKEIRRRIGENIAHFKENVDFIDLSQRVGESHTLELLKSMGYSKQSIVQAEHIYLLSERGYLKLIKIMDNALAWDTYNQVIDGYFHYQEEQKGSGQLARREAEIKLLDAKTKADRAVAMKANAFTRRAKEFRKVCEAAGVDPNYIALGFFKICQGKDVDLPELGVTVGSPTYDQKQIAEKLGILSASGKPHAQAVGCILGELKLEESEIERVPFESHGHADTYLRYKESVLNKVAGWLEENQFPQTLCSRNKRFKVCYSRQSVSK